MKRALKCPGRQRGAVLVVSLLMLVVVTLLAVSSVNSGTVNLRIVDNMRAQQEAEAAAQQAIEVVLSDVINFENKVAYTDLPFNHVKVSTSAPQCLMARPSSGCSATWELCPEDTAWELVAEVAPNAAGAEANLHQGVSIRLVAGSCN
jgi:Tfp pilus assembly protein PilX